MRQTLDQDFTPWEARELLSTDSAEAFSSFDEPPAMADDTEDELKAILRRSPSVKRSASPYLLPGIGDAALLTKEQELELTTSLERGYKRVLRLLSDMDAVYPVVLSRLDDLSNHQLLIKGLFRGLPANTKKTPAKLAQTIEKLRKQVYSQHRRSHKKDTDKHDRASRRSLLCELDLSFGFIAHLVDLTLKTREKDLLRAYPFQDSNLDEEELLESRAQPELRETLQIAWRSVQAIRNQLVLANMRLVISIAKNFATTRMPITDLIQQGTFGLLKAIEKFDHRLGFKFSTYATNWIRQSLSRYLGDQGREIRVPIFMSNRLVRLQAAENRLREELGREPSTSELAKACELPEDSVRFCRGIRNPISAATPLFDSDELCLGDRLVDPTSEAEDYHGLLNESCESSVRKALTRLDPRSAYVIQMRFGIGDLEPVTLEEVARILGISRERVRQIECAAMKKLKGSTELARLLMDLG